MASLADKNVLIPLPVGWAINPQPAGASPHMDNGIMRTHGWPRLGRLTSAWPTQTKQFGLRRSHTYWRFSASESGGEFGAGAGLLMIISNAASDIRACATINVIHHEVGLIVGVEVQACLTDTASAG